MSNSRLSSLRRKVTATMPSNDSRLSDEIPSVQPLEVAHEYLFPPGIKSVQLLVIVGGSYKVLYTTAMPHCSIIPARGLC